jgi:hypothetical protein
MVDQELAKWNTQSSAWNQHAESFSAEEWRWDFERQSFNVIDDIWNAAEERAHAQELERQRLTMLYSREVPGF